MHNLNTSYRPKYCASMPVLQCWLSQRPFNAACAQELVQTCIPRQQPDRVGQQDGAEGAADGALGPRRHCLVDANQADPVAWLAAVHEVVLQSHFCAARELARWRCFRQLL